MIVEPAYQLINIYITYSSVTVSMTFDLRIFSQYFLCKFYLTRVFMSVQYLHKLTLISRSCRSGKTIIVMLRSLAYIHFLCFFCSILEEEVVLYLVVYSLQHIERQK